MPPIHEGRWARRLLALFGWSVDVVLPSVPRCVIAVYPHTSNWDFLFGYLAKLAVGAPVHFMAKHTLFRPPFGALLHGMGGIPVDRRTHARLVERLAIEMETRPWMWLAIAPEGTRAYVDHWRSGFYRLAVAAKVPIGFAFIDYGTHTVGLKEYLFPTGDAEADLERARAAYAGKIGKRPELAGKIRFATDREA